MVEVVDEEDGAQLLGLEGARQLHEQVHARIPHAIQIVIQLPILHNMIIMMMVRQRLSCNVMGCLCVLNKYVKCQNLHHGLKV